MSNIVDLIAGYVSDRVVDGARALPNGAADQRIIFHGPPHNLLDSVFEKLTENDAIVAVVESGEEVKYPILLADERLEPGQSNPAVGESGRCDASHLLSLRNTPACPRFVALVAPASHSILSVAQATESFGLSLGGDNGGQDTSAWWADPFVQFLADRAAGQLWPTDGATREQALRLLELAVRAADLGDAHDPSRRAAWATVARVLSITEVLGQEDTLTAANLWSLACGFPPTGEVNLNAEAQGRAIGMLMAAIVEEGYSPVASRLKEGANEDERSAVEQCLQQLQQRCEVPLRLAEAACFFYAPTQGSRVEQPPQWWVTLRAERLIDLLREEPERKPEGGLEVRCTNALSVTLPGLNVSVVASVVEIEVTVAGAIEDDLSISLDRKGRAAHQRTWPLVLSAGHSELITDDDLPSHREAVRYVASADELANVAVRVVSLAHWEAGVVVSCRTAAKLKLPKRASGHAKAYDWECDVLLEGEGRHLLELLLAEGVEVKSPVTGLDLSVEPHIPLRADVAPIKGGAVSTATVEVTASGECEYDLHVSRDGDSQILRVKIACSEASAEGCRSEFERLVRMNRSGDGRRGALEVQVDRQVRLVDLQQWALNPASIGKSYYPIVVAADCRLNWRPPTWPDAGATVLSKCEFLHDPRPPGSAMLAPADFCDARRRIAKRLRGDGGDGLVETGRLGEWMLEASFAEDVQSYLEAYLAWLEADSDAAAWADLVAVCRIEAGAGTLDPEPDAILISPLHPVRLAWHCVAQGVLLGALNSNRPCPAASILSSGSVPDSLALPVRLPTGEIASVTYLSLETDSDYWGVLWNGKRLNACAAATSQTPFDRELGIRVGGVTTGFSVSQVRRALDDVVMLRSAKPVLNVAISSSTGLSDACNDGVVAWARERFPGGSTTEGTPRLLGTRELRIFDDRSAIALPEDAAVANLAEETGGAVSWYKGIRSSVRPDIGIVAQLGASSASLTFKAQGTPITTGALVRLRLRSQLLAGNGAFLTESRSALPAPSSGASLEDLVARGVARLENLTSDRAGYTFAPSVKSVQSLFDDAGADYVAVSSSVVDPACFLGSWLPGTYLWDYELPSYSQRAGDTNGYYLLTRVRSAERDALKDLLASVEGCANLSGEQVSALLAEVSRRGVPTIRGLSAGRAGASGDLGLFVAGRLIQDEFRGGAPATTSILPVLAGSAQQMELGLVIPVDPFRGYLHDLRNGAGAEDARRPDLLAVGIRVSDTAVCLRLTPIEVKYRRGEVMSPAGRASALAQASSLATLLEELRSIGQQEGMTIWRLAWQHLLVSMLDFGFRVYSQQHHATTDRGSWDGLHGRVITAVLHGEASVEIDQRGRLVLCDDHHVSEPRDDDNDGFSETIIISPADVGRVITGDPVGLYGAIRDQVGTWEFLPVGDWQAGDGGSDDGPLGRAPQSQQPGGDLPDAAGGLTSGASDVTSLAGVPHAAVSIVVESPSHSKPPIQVKPSVAMPVDPMGISVLVGRTATGFNSDPRFLRPNLTDLTQLNIGVVGDLGTGKTQLLKSLVHQIVHAPQHNHGVRPRFLILDYKKDYRSKDFVDAVGARVVEPHNMPLNLFAVSGTTSGHVPWMSRFKFFADVLSKIYSNVGPVQRENLKQAVRVAFEESGKVGRQPTIFDVHAQYHAHVKGKVDAPLSIIGDMVDMELFTRDPDATVPFEQFLDGVVVLSLDSLGQDDRTKNTVVAIMLNLFYEQMLHIPKRPFIGTDPQLRTVDSFLLVDEADNIMRYEFDVLRRILLQGREFGVGVILASQYLSHFKAGATDYREPLLSWAIHRVPNVTPQELSALGLTGDLAHVAERIKQLEKYHCLFKTYEVPGVIVRGMPHHELLGE